MGEEDEAENDGNTQFFETENDADAWFFVGNDGNETFEDDVELDEFFETEDWNTGDNEVVEDDWDVGEFSGVGGNINIVEDMGESNPPSDVGYSSLS